MTANHDYETGDLLNESKFAKWVFDEVGERFEAKAVGAPQNYHENERKHWQPALSLQWQDHRPVKLARKGLQIHFSHVCAPWLVSSNRPLISPPKQVTLPHVHCGLMTTKAHDESNQEGTWGLGYACFLQSLSFDMKSGYQTPHRWYHQSPQSRQKAVFGLTWMWDC